MSQECTKEESICARSSENGSWYEYVSICKTWENKWIESASICIDFEEYTVPNECLKVELKCTRVMKQNDICLNSVKYLNKQLDAVNEQIALINEWVGITSELVDSSVCSIKVSDSDDREKYTSCTNKQVAIDPYSQDVDILDLVSIKNTTSKMMLREITSSDNTLKLKYENKLKIENLYLHIKCKINVTRILIILLRFYINEFIFSIDFSI